MPLIIQPFAESQELEAVRARLAANVPRTERVASIGIGAALISYGLSRRSLSGGLLALGGAALIARGVSGHCALYQKLGINSRLLNTEAGVPGEKGIKVVRTIMIDRQPSELYQYWRQLENLPQFMEHVKSVEELDELRSHWVVKGPAGADLEWNAAIVTDQENEMISWESLPGAEVQNAGSVWFEPAKGGDSTNLKVSLKYQPPAGILGAAIAKLFGEAPDQRLANDLQRFKQIMESGAVPVSKE